MLVLTEKPSLADSSEYSSGSQNKPGEEELAAVPISTFLGSKIFTVLVGADGHDLAVHECALSRSPVLQRFCRGGFLEATTGRIELKDDDPEIFDKVLSYLYRGNYQPYMPHASLRPGNNSPSAKSVVPWSTTGLDDKYAMDSAMVYIMADKYQLHGLKKVAVRKINGLQPLSHDAFLKISSCIYAAVPESDRIFRDFFIEHAPDQLRNASQAELTPIHSCRRCNGKGHGARYPCGAPRLC